MLSALRRVAGQVPQVHRAVTTAAAWRAVAAPIAVRAYAKRGPPHPSESFLRGSSATYIEEMFLAWKNDPSSVHKSWDVYFRQVENGAPPGAGAHPHPRQPETHAFASSVCGAADASYRWHGRRRDAACRPG